jgi:hypothetical protein
MIRAKCKNQMCLEAAYTYCRLLTIFQESLIKMDQKLRNHDIVDKLQELKSKINLLLPMIRCCKDELNNLTLQEMEIRSALRSKLEARVKLESLEAPNELRVHRESDPERILGASHYMDIEDDDEETEDTSCVTESATGMDYREFLTLDPKIIRMESDEEEDDDEDAGENCGNVLLSEDED